MFVGVYSYPFVVNNPHAAHIFRTTRKRIGLSGLLEGRLASAASFAGPARFGGSLPRSRHVRSNGANVEAYFNNLPWFDLQQRHFDIQIAELIAGQLNQLVPYLRVLRRLSQFIRTAADAQHPR